jgi:hypothetical protein
MTERLEMTRRNSFFAVLLVATSFILSIQISVAEEMKSGEINWVQGYITAIGNGTADPSGNKVKDKLKSLRAAELVAQRTLLETIKGVNIDSRTRVEDLMVKEDIINSRVEGIIKGAQIVKREVNWEENIPMATVEVRICLSNRIGGCSMNQSLISALDIDHKNEPSFVPPERLIPPADTVKEPAPLPPEPQKKSITYDSSKPVTGVIFDLEGRAFERQLLPVVITLADGDKQITVYSVKSVKPPVIRSYGVVRYADDREQAKKNTYIGDNTVVIPVANITKENMIVIGPEAARIIRETTMHGNDYLGDAKVIVSSN